MNIVFRVDSSVQMGIGHVMRCLALASILRQRGAAVTFVCQELKGNLCSYIESIGYKVHRLLSVVSESPENPNIPYSAIEWELDAKNTIAFLESEHKKIDCMVVDHYGLDSQWERKIRPYIEKILVIDDQADRSHLCDLLMDSDVICEDVEKKYEKLVPSACKFFFGPEFTLLRSEFEALSATRKVRDAKVRRIFVFMGGGDSSNQTAKVLEGIGLLKRLDIIFDVVISTINPYKLELQNLANRMANTILHVQPQSMATLMNEADMAVGAGGMTMWERCFLWLPSLVVVLADNQRVLTERLARKGMLTNLGDIHKLTTSDYKCAMEAMIQDGFLRKTQSLKCSEFGVGARVDELVSYIQESCVSKTDH
jgi:UDP-2,4-diacetamido-2,4,6-trideoxy-beta-L-altropyranose hydrolase